MARVGINARIAVNGETQGAKDLTCEVSKTEIEISSRGYAFVRYLTGQKRLPVDFNVEADSPMYNVLKAAFWADTSVHVVFTDGSDGEGQGGGWSGYFLVTKFADNAPTNGEYTFAVSLRIDANADSEPTMN